MMRNQYDLPSTLSEPALNNLTQLAAHLCSAPISLIILTDQQQPLLKAHHGLPEATAAHALPWYANAVKQADIWVVTDATLNPCFADNPLVTGEEHIRFFASVPLLKAGEALGLLCILDRMPREFTESQRVGVQMLAAQVLEHLELLDQTRKLSEGDIRYRTLFEYAQVGILLADAESYYLDANATACQMFGYTRQEFIGLHAADIVVAAEVPKIAVALNEIHDQADHFQEWRFRRKDGSVFSAEVKATKMPDGTLLGTVRDLSERNRADEYRQYLSAIVESSTDAIIGASLDGLVTSWNAGATALYGYGAAEMIGMPITRLLPPDRQAEEASLLQTLGRNEYIAPFETVRQAKDGTLIDVSVAASPIKDASGKVVGGSKIIRDITNLKKHEREIARLTRLYAALSQINQAIVWSPTREALFHQVTKVLVEHGEFGMAWIGWHDAALSQLVPLAASGNDNGYLQSIKVYTDDRPPGRTPSSTAFITRQPYVCNDMLSDPATQPWRSKIETLGFRSCAAFPIRLNGEVSGTLTVTSQHVGYFQDREIALLVEAAMDLSFGLDNFASDAQLRIAQDAMRRNEARLQLVVQVAQLGYWEVDRRTSTAYCSDLHYEIFGYHSDRPEWSLELFMAHIHPDDHAWVQKTVQAARANKLDLEFECRMVRRDRVLRWIKVVGRFFHYPHEDSLRVLGVCEDITERKQAEEKLRTSEATARLLAEMQNGILNALPAQIALIDAQGCIVSANDSWQRFANSDALLNSQFKLAQSNSNAALLTGADSSQDARAVTQGVAQVLRGELREFAFEYPHHLSNEQRWFRLVVTPLHDDRQLGAVVMHTDITERKRWEEQSNQAQKMEALGTLAGGIAHDFNNIIGIILGNIYLAKLDIDQAHPIWQSMIEIETVGQRAKNLIQHILSFSRQQPLERQVMSLGPVIEEAISLLRSTLPAGVEIVHSLASPVSQIKGDSTQMHQVIINLCTNAWHALSGHAGQIKIGLENVVLSAEEASLLGGIRPGAYVALSVGDNGMGMDESTRKRIFEPFFTTKPVGQGTGLGLASVHGIIQNHEGGIKVTSQPGQGSTFCLYFPAADEAVAQPLRSTGPAITHGHGERILYLDDEKPLVYLTKRALERLGYRVTGFTSPVECLKKFQEDPDQFDLIITDFNMPGLSGLQVADQILKLRPNLTVLLSSGHITEDLKDAARRIGVRQLVYKPNTVDELAETIARYTGKAHTPSNGRP